MNSSLRSEIEPFLQGFVHSKEPFPVDFGIAWRWTGYTSATKARRALRRVKSPISNRLSLQAFKDLCALSRTLLGSDVLQFLDDLEPRPCVKRRRLDTASMELDVCLKTQRTLCEMVEAYEDALDDPDERDKVMIKDLKRTHLHPEKIIRSVRNGTVEYTQREISIPLVCQEIGVNPGTKGTVIGRKMASLYRKRYACDPPKRDTLLRGRPCRENSYFQKDYDLMITAIRDVLNY